MSTGDVLRPVCRQIAKAFDLPIFQVEGHLAQEPSASAIAAFLKPDGPAKLLIYMGSGKGFADEEGEMYEDDEVRVFVATGEADIFARRGVLLLKSSEAVAIDSPAALDAHVSCTVVLGSPVKSLLATLEHAFQPVLSSAVGTWGAQLADSGEELFSGVGKYVGMLADAVHTVEGGIELARPSMRNTEAVELKPPAFARIAQNPEVIESYEGAVAAWCVTVEELLTAVPGAAVLVPEGDEGPSTELEYWKGRMQRFASVSEQLRSRENRVVLGVLGCTRSAVLRRWKAIEPTMSEAANEARDNTKYLQTFEKFFETLTSGTPLQIVDCFPSIFSNVKMMHTISRYYNSEERLTTFLCKLTNQLVRRAVSYLEAPGKLWTQPFPELIDRLNECLALEEAYRDEYTRMRESTKGHPDRKALDLDEVIVFGKLELLVRRIAKLVELFSTVTAFTELTAHSLEGMEGMLRAFKQLVDSLKARPYSLLDFTQLAFDADLLSFRSTIAELEAALQAFINRSFETISSTEAALQLLKRYRSLLQRESLREDLDAKLTVVFHNYGLDLETSQMEYERNKESPPIARNAPPVAGNILWARQLLRRIEAPMAVFQESEQLMRTKESKKIVKTYNRIARTIVEFETLWHLAWGKSIDASKAGLQATLLIRHPANGRLIVNFDKEILLLIRETKCLLRMGVKVPESARNVVLQEDKFKSFYNRLSFGIRQLEHVLSRMLPITQSLLRPHVRDIEERLRPGFSTLSWTSMNIDAFLHSMYNGVDALEDLAGKVKDCVDNRIERNLKIVSNMKLVDLPTDDILALDKFCAMQEKMVKSQLGVIAAKNEEVEEAVGDLLELIASFPLRSGPAGRRVAEEQKLKDHYSRMFYRAVLNATKHSLKQFKTRMGSKASGGFLFVDRPIFDVNVELAIPHVSMAPALDDIQAAINRSCRSILAIGKSLPVWSTPEAKASGATLFDSLATDKEVVVMVLLLTGSIVGAKRQVLEYLTTFRKYDWLWQGNKEQEYAEFMRTSPSLADFEAKLKLYVDIEREVSKIAPVHNIGALSLETSPLKYSLRSEATAWKALFGRHLHEKASAELEACTLMMANLQRNLKRPINDIDDVRLAMGYLKEVRTYESIIDDYLAPVEDMYATLSRYEVELGPDELDQVVDLRYTWKKIIASSNDLSADLQHVQSDFKKDLVKNVKVFITDVAQFRLEFEVSGPMEPGLPPSEANERLKRFQREFDKREKLHTTYSQGEGLFGLPVTEYPELWKTKKELDLLDRLYSLYMSVTDSVGEWREMAWLDVGTELGAVQVRIGEFQTACSKMPKELRQWDAYVELKRLIDDFVTSVPLVQQLAHPAMRMRHWAALMEVTGQHLPIGTEEFRLKTVLEAGLLTYREEVEDIANSAVKELQIEEKLAAITDDWSDEQLSFANFKQRGQITLKAGETAELMEKVEETLMALGSMMASRYVTPFRDSVQGWVSKLSSVSDVLEVWIQVQAMWIYLEAVFTSGDIAKQLPQESKRFNGIDGSWEKVMLKALETRNVVLYIVGNDVLAELLPHLLEQLEVCQKALSGYLDQKRACFPRFYFVSDANLLEVLSQGSNPQAVQQHLQSVFDSVVRVEFDAANASRIVTLFSPQGERVELEKPVDAVGNIEEWLYKLLKAMQGSVNAQVRAASADCEQMALADFTHKYQAQVSLIGIQFKWTLDCEDALYQAKTVKGVMNATNKKNQQRLDDLVALNLLPDEDLLQHGKWSRTKIETMILVDVHQRDVFADMIKAKIKDADHFEWQKQARFYFQHDKDVALIAVADVDFDYCNEYLGVKERLVITPLTDRCYIALSQALGMCLGGAPAGPAGTGKTETTKDMGNTLGKYTVVFNCGDQMDYRIMGAIYKGLSQSGCWGCFDEFNRIDLEVLSVVAQQVSSVLNAIKGGKASFQFTDGHTISLDAEVGFFITMNPGYAGRQELPENLKSLFRGVMMMVPDRQIIMKVKLTACGYKENELLAKKFNVLYALCEQQLSKCPHYDFGLRNILAVLRTAGESKRNNLTSPELLLLMRTLRDMNLSKFVAEDVPLFLSLIGDLFPGQKADKMEHPYLEGPLVEVVKNLGLQMHGLWKEKIIQLWEMALVRHSVMLVGPAGVGKTRILEVLMATLTACTAAPGLPALVGENHREQRMNPKAITAPQMFGCLDVVANEWTEGIFAQLWRKANKDKKNFTWLVLDGPVDAIWIENMNTVMDDNKSTCLNRNRIAARTHLSPSRACLPQGRHRRPLQQLPCLLTLANNDRIPMLRPNVTLQFEVEDLRNASPATVSRAGIIYVSNDDLGWSPMAASYLAKLPEEQREPLRGFFDAYVAPMLDFVQRECSPRMACSEMGLVASLTAQLTALIHATVEVVVGQHIPPLHLERIFIVALIWTIAGVLENDGRRKVDHKLRTLTKAMPDDVADEDSVYEYRVNEVSGSWEHWGSRVPAWEFAGDVRKSFANILVPTIDSVRCEFTLELSLGQRRPVLLVGGPGTAKTSTVLQVLAKQNPAEVASKTISFSSATTPSIFQATMEGAVEKRQGKTFGPPGGKRMVVFIDDISMPEVNTWGDQITLEIVRQLIEQTGFYNLQKPGEYKYIVDVDLLGCMLTPGGGKNDIPNRAKRHFHVMNVTLPSMASINQIFGSMASVFFGADGVPSEVAEAATRSLVAITADVWSKVKTKMLPTPAKFHYIFNLRDLSRVFQGVFQCPANEGVLATEADLLSLWIHECHRVFADRLINLDDKAWCEACVLDAATQAYEGSDPDQLAGLRYFVDFLRPPGEDPETGEELPAPKVYEPAESLSFLKERATDHMERFNLADKLHAVTLVLFEDALMHLTRVARILRTPRCSALLVGVGGSGRQSLTRLAAHINSCLTSQIVITKSYNVNNLLEDWKPLCLHAGCKGKGVAFIFTDKEIKEESFLEYVNIFLNTGELPNLFDRSELDAIGGELMPEFEAQMPKGTDPTPAKLFSFFISRVRANLHLVLCFSPIGEKFRQRARAFPGLINECTVDWYLPWPAAALVDVAELYLQDLTLAGLGPEVKASLIGHVAQTHLSVSAGIGEYFERYRRNVYVTPKSYLSFLTAYAETYSKKVANLEILASSINTGLEKLAQATEDVDVMKIELREKDKVLQVAKQKSKVLLDEITQSTTKAEKKKSVVLADKTKIEAEAAVINSEKAIIDGELADAQPALDAADEALKMVTAKDIGLLKGLKSPPNLIQRLFDCVLLLLRCDIVRDDKVCNIAVEGKLGLQLADSWKAALSVMSQSDFLERILKFDRDSVNDEDVELLHPYRMAPDFNFESAKKVSSNVAGLCVWVDAMCQYVEISKVVKPKIALLKGKLAQLAAANKRLDAAMADLAVVKAELDKMQVDFDTAMAEKARIQADADATQRRMDAANRLIGGLSGEQTRWTAQSEAFADETRRLTGDVALACAFMGYAGPFNADFRTLLLRDRFESDAVARGVPVTVGIDVTSFMVDEATVGDWAIEGLPTDELSVQNGIMVTRSSRWPLLIDPQGQALAWIKRREENNSLRVSQLSEKRFRNQLEDAMAFGQPLLLENVEEVLDPLLDPVLDKSFQRKGRNLVIQLADKECEYTETFALFLCSKLPNPHFSPELSAQATVVNMTVTMAGLEQQLLGRVVQMERPELEEQRQKLVADVNANQRTLKGLEDDLLYRLANSTGNLLDDTSLIEVLQMSKETSIEVSAKLETAKETDTRISAAREEYRPVATRGSLLYFLIVDMAGINPTYQVSLQQFLELFDQSIERAAPAPLASKRIVNIVEYATFHVTCYIQRGLFERHKIMWCLMLTMKIQQIANELTGAAVQALLTAGGALDLKSEAQKPAEWMPDAVWLNCLAISRAVPAVFGTLVESLRARSGEWRAWYDHDAPETQKSPLQTGASEVEMNAFQKLLLVRSVRDDRMLLAAQDYISGAIGARFVDSRPLDLKAVEEEATCRSPIIAVLSQGSDPTALIMELARKKKKTVRSISLGQGQEPAARKLINTGVTQGSWVMLQNCHLGLKFMAEIEQTMIKLEEIHEEFQLWITAEPNPLFPIGLLQMSIKITNEAPAGVRAGLKASYAWINQDMLDAVSHPHWKTMLYALCFMHTIVQERRKFGPLGFNIPYEFNQSDLSACVTYMQNHLNYVSERKRDIDWECLNYMICMVQYGGRITDDFDRHLFATYGLWALNPNVLDANFRFYDAYRVPAGVEVEAYRKYIEKLPIVDNPAIFGLHANADIVYRTRQTAQVLTTVLDVQPKAGGGGGGETREDVVLRMVKALQEKLPPNYKGDDVRDAIKKLGGARPLNICLQQEVDRLQKVISVVRTSLADLVLAIAGTIVMSPDVTDALDKLFMARVPASWIKASQLDAPNTGVWFTAMVKRAEQLTGWLKGGRPACFWLTGLFNPQGFLTANRQEVCRKHNKDGWALDDVVNSTEVLRQEREEVRKGPDEGSYFYGLFLEGCKWDKLGNKLADSDPKILFAPLPVLHVTGVLANPAGSSGAPQYACPVYKNPKRTGLNFVFTVHLRTEEAPAKWAMRGVCLLHATE